MTSSLFDLAGRLGLGSYFVYTGYIKLLHFAAASDRLSQAGIAVAKLVLAMTLFLQFLGGLMLVLGARSRLAAVLLASYMVAYIYYFQFHALAEISWHALFRDLAIVGGLLHVAAFGARRFSLDGK